MNNKYFTEEEFRFWGGINAYDSYFNDGNL